MTSSTAASTATRPSAERSPWIVSARFDLAFFVASPLLILAAMLPLAGRFSSFGIYLAVMSFSSMGHHLPGFLRAYGDAELFRRFRWRFLLAPPLVFAVFLVYGLNDMRGMAFLLMAWSIWHVGMQHFGFLRIYDARVGSVDPWTAKLDWLLSLGWFGSVVLASPQYTHNLLAVAADTSGLAAPAAVVRGTQWAVWGLTAAVSVAYVLNAVRAWRAGRPPSLVKLTLLAGTSVFLWFVWVRLGDLFLGLAIWELFHDLQYFALTWIYNRRLVEQGQGTTRFMNFLFRRRMPLVLLYVVGIFAYGGSSYFFQGTQAQLQVVLMALVFTSTFLHYYYDGFIWKVRQKRTRTGLGLDEEEAPARATLWSRLTAGTGLGPRLAHGLAVVVPIGGLAAIETLGPEDDDLAVRRAIRDAVPAADEAHVNFGRACLDAGLGAEAVAAYEHAVELAPESPAAHAGLAVALLTSGGEQRAEEAYRHLEQALALDPDDVETLLNAAVLRVEQNRVDAAVELYRRARERDPRRTDSSPHAALLEGFDALASGDLPRAVDRFGTACAERPDDLVALDGLAFAAERLGALDIAVQALTRLVEARPDRAENGARLSFALLSSGRPAEAAARLSAHVERFPEDLDRKLWLAEVLATNADARVRDGAAALLHARQVVAAVGTENAGALDILAAAYAESGRFDEAEEHAALALAAAERQNLGDAAAAIRARLELYRQRRPYHQDPTP